MSLLIAFFHPDVHAGGWSPQWMKTAATSIGDAAIAPDGTVWIAGTNGSIWYGYNSATGADFVRLPAEGFRRLAVGANGMLWAVGFNGTVWSYDTATPYSSEKWVKAPVAGMADVAVAPNGTVWTAGKNGNIWYSYLSATGLKFKKLPATGFSRVAVGSDGTLWAVGSNGSLWHYDTNTPFVAGKWIKTPASLIGDVAVEPAGTVWVAGKNGTIWYSSSFSQGNNFKKIPASNFGSVAAGSNGLWAVGKNGTLWNTPTGDMHFYTDHGKLLDTAGFPVLLHGVNVMSAWDNGDPTGAIAFPEVRKTGANTVRIVWQSVDTQNVPTTAATLDSLISNAVHNHLIPMVELHDGTWGVYGAMFADQVAGCASYWTRPDVLAVLQKHQANVLVNIGNELGDYQIDVQTFVDQYSNAVQRMRDSGIHAPLVIDSTDGGKDPDILDGAAPALITADPDRNLVFSLHFYWNKLLSDIDIGTDSRGGYVFIKQRLDTSLSLGYPLIIGEFSQWGAWTGNGGSICAGAGEVDYASMLRATGEDGIGWYAWSWGPGNNYSDPLCVAMDMTDDRIHVKMGWATDVVNAIGQP